MSPLAIILTIILVLLLVGLFPAVGVIPAAYGPSSVLFIVLIIILVLALTGKL